MRLLLDTQAFLWFILNSPALSEKARNLICDPNNQIEISPASLWEIAIKISIGKYALKEPVAEFLEHEIKNNQFRLLPIEPRHIAPLTLMQFHHRDPFDRLIIAQAIVENISIISSDVVFDKYSVLRLW